MARDPPRPTCERTAHSTKTVARVRTHLKMRPACTRVQLRLREPPRARLRARPLAWVRARVGRRTRTRTRMLTLRVLASYQVGSLFRCKLGLVARIFTIYDLTIPRSLFHALNRIHACMCLRVEPALTSLRPAIAENRKGGSHFHIALPFASFLACERVMCRACGPVR